MKRRLSIAKELLLRGILVMPIFFAALYFVSQGINRWVIRMWVILFGLYAAGIAKHVIYGQLGFDERTKEIFSKALVYSWFCSLAVVSVLIVSEYFNYLALTAFDILGAILYTKLIVVITYVLYYQLNAINLCEADEE